MKILHVLSTNRISGAENVVADICMMFDGIYEMAYCSVNGPIKESLEDRGVKFIPLEKMSTLQVRKVIKEYKPDIIHAHDVRATVIATLVSGNIPVISHLHVNSDTMSRITIKSVLYLLSTMKVKRIIVVSKSCINEYAFKNNIKNKTIVLKNIIYLNRINKLIDRDVNDYDFDFVYLGRLNYQKNPQRIAKVSANVLKKCPNAKFGIIGQGELKEEMEKIFGNEGVLNRVIFTGNLPYPYKALKNAKCMLMCSRYEGLPIAALEAMALGVPIVSTPVDGMRDIINHNETGILSSENEELINSVIRLLSDERLYKNMSSLSRKRFQDLNDENYYKEKLKSIYDEI
jgi:glycosyltransferase involved in cell wall biosynthesis